MKQLFSIVVCSLLLLPLILPAQNSAEFKHVWSLEESIDSKAKIVWSTESLQNFPDSINQIKNVKANSDLDGDGKKEFMVPILHKVDGIDRRSIYVFENNGNDVYDAVWSYIFPDSATEFVTVDESDLDGDGALEILAVHMPRPGVSANPAVLYVFEHTGSDNDYGTGPVVSWDLGTPGRDNIRVAKAADLDGDGTQEVVMVAFTTNPSMVIASVDDFAFPTWTTEFSDDLGTINPDNAAIGIGDMDNDGTPEVIHIEGRQDTLVIVEATAANTYAMNFVAMPDVGIATAVSVHGIDVTDANDDGRDETYMASLFGPVWVVATSGDAMNIAQSDIIMIKNTGEQLLEASVGDLGFGGSDFTIAASNATKAINMRYVGGTGGDVKDPANYVFSTVVDSGDVATLVPGGIRVYGLDIGEDLDGDGIPEVIFSRGSTRGGTNAPALFIAEINYNIIPAVAIPDSINQIKNVKANSDLDGDGKKEFMVPILHKVDGIDRRSIYVFENNGNDVYDAVWSYIFPDSATEFVTVDESDLDGDGALEILAVHMPRPGVSANPAVLYVFEHTGSDNDYGTGPVVSWDLGTPGRDNIRVAKAADLDGDGTQEVVMVAFTTNPSMVIASVDDFAFPTWTTEFSDDLGTINPDNAAIGIGDMDNDGTPEVIHIEGRQDTLVIVEATAANTYAMNFVAMPDVGIATAVSVHGIDVTDANDDGRDETYMASLFGPVWVVATSGDAMNIAQSDIIMIKNTGEQLLEASVGDLGFGGSDFTIAASNATKAINMRYVGGTGGDVKDPANYVFSTVVDSGDVATLVPGGIRVYGLDIGEDLDGDGIPEVIFSRGSTRGGTNAPALFIFEGNLYIVGINPELNVPVEYDLAQNYPNPFNPETVISYALPTATDVNLSIYNVLGQKVRTLVNGYRTAKVHEVTWNGLNDNNASVPSGIYFYRLETKDFSKTVRMLLIR